MINKVFVIFEDDKTNWWSWLLKKGCRHCYLVKPSPNGYIIHGKKDRDWETR